MPSTKHRPAQIEITPISGEEGSIRLQGELPHCPAKLLPRRYFRHMEALLRSRCRTLDTAGTVTLQVSLCSPTPEICSVQVEGVLRSEQRMQRFFTDGSVWNLRSGLPVLLGELSGGETRLRRLWKKMEPRREPEWLLRTCPDWEKRAKRAISRHRFYLEEGYLAFYFPPETMGGLVEDLCRLPLDG